MGALDRKDFELELPESWPEDVRRVVEDGRDGSDGCNGENAAAQTTVAIVAAVAERNGSE